MAVEYRADTAFQAKTPKALFQVSPDTSDMSTVYALATWDVTADGSRFLLTTPAEESTAAPFTVMLNWTSLLEK